VSERGSGAEDSLSVLDAAKERLSQGTWPLFVRTRHLQTIAVDDLCAVYAAGAGKNSRSFIGIARVAQVETARRNWVEGNQAGYYKYSSSGIAKMLHLSDQTIWPSPVPIQGLIDRLDFIKNKEKWGQCLQGGCKLISRSDFELICASSTQRLAG